METAIAVAALIVGLLIGYVVRGIGLKSALADAKKAADAALESERNNHKMVVDEIRRNAEQRVEETRRYAAETMAKISEKNRADTKAMVEEMIRNGSNQLRSDNLQSLQTLLSPLGKDIDSFKEQFIAGKSAMSRHIQDLMAQTLSIGKDAQRLASALQANNKLQGNWGEAILQNLLEASGLEQKRDFDLQPHYQDPKSGKTLIPDVVVHLPENRHLIVDSKVSLSAYAAYSAAESDDEKAQSLRDHIASVRRHVKELSEKDYPAVVSGSIGYVLMFVPNEAAFVAAVCGDPKLTTDAYASRIILINPTNLLMALQLAYNLWQSEKQKENVESIYASAEKLYKKFVLFAQNFVAIGKSIDQLQSTYQQAEKRLNSGNGNIVRQLELWKKKGLNTRSAIPPELASSANDEDDE